MRFEARELKSCADPVKAPRLRKGRVYLAVQYLDPKMLVPVVETLFFIGSNLRRGDKRLCYFQTVESHQRGVRYGSSPKGEFFSFRIQAEDQLNHIFEFDQALDELMRCSIRRTDKLK